MTVTYSAFTAAGLTAVRSGAGQPLLLTNASVHTFDPLIGTMRGADVLIGDGVVVGVGPGIVTAADDDGAVVIDATDTTVLPARPDLPAQLGDAERGTGAGTLAPGATADLIVLAGELTPALNAALLAASAAPQQILAVFRNGTPTHWAGSRLDGDPTAQRQGEPGTVDPQRVGVWIDSEDFLHQELTADGRYDETRGGRRHAFQGRYWVTGDRIDYLDDLGFWAFGRFDGDTLHHAGYAMRRKDDR